MSHFYGRRLIQGSRALLAELVHSSQKMAIEVRGGMGFTRRLANDAPHAHHLVPARSIR